MYTIFFLKYKHNSMHSTRFIIAGQAKGIHQYKNVINSLVRINILLFKIKHSCGAGNNINSFLQEFDFKGTPHNAFNVYAVKATPSKAMSHEQS